jgi:hypothetical protein
VQHIRERKKEGENERKKKRMNEWMFYNKNSVAFIYKSLKYDVGKHTLNILETYKNECMISKFSKIQNL